MKVKDVMVCLSKSSPDSEVYISIDEEGNDFHPFVTISEGYLRTDHDEVIPADDREYIEVLREEHVELQKIVILWP
jgi:hypothetical protein